MTNTIVTPQPHGSVLVVGVYLADKPNLAVPLTQSILQSEQWTVQCQWARLGSKLSGAPLASQTKLNISQRMDKYAIINLLLAEVAYSEFDYIFIVDDDIAIPDRFIDSYLEIVSKREFSLSQPARTHSSFIDHYFVAQLLGVESRLTNFVEIGPIVCFHRSSYSVLLPLDEEAPMGWGLDFIWPIQMNEHGLRMGIVDQFPVDHSFRKPVQYYDYADSDFRMKKYFESRDHLSYEQSFITFESFPLA
jgi:hypothetical protein